MRYDHLDQQDESDIHFLRRIGRDHDALVTVKGGVLLMVDRGEGMSASGAPLTPEVVTRQMCLTHDALLSTRLVFDKVMAQWHDRTKGQRATVAAGDGAPTLRMRQTYPTENEARAAAEAKLREVAQGSDSISVTMVGNPFLAAEGRILAVGFRIGVDGLWSITRVVHRLTGSGSETTIEGEKPNPEDG